MPLAMTQATDTETTVRSLVERTPDSLLPAESAESAPPKCSSRPQPDENLAAIAIATSPGTLQRNQGESSASDEAERPQLRSCDDVMMFEAFDIETGAFTRCFWTHFDTEHRAWMGQTTQMRKYDLSLEDIVLNLRRIPDEKAFPTSPQQLTLAPPVFEPVKHYLKRPQIDWLSGDDESTLVPQMHIEEVQTLESLRRHPHPNIVTYHGCVVARGRIVGIVLGRVWKTLYEYFLDLDYFPDNNDDDDDDDDHDDDDAAAADAPLNSKSNSNNNNNPQPPLNIPLLEEQLKSAIAHIHSLGLAHNDLKPSNLGLFLDEDEKDHHPQLVVIDWGSCKNFGEELISAGTPGWTHEEGEEEDDVILSKPEHDLFAIGKVGDWMRMKMEGKGKGVRNMMGDE